MFNPLKYSQLHLLCTNMHSVYCYIHTKNQIKFTITKDIFNSIWPNEKIDLKTQDCERTTNGYRLTE